MKKESILVEVEEVGMEVDTVASLLSTFERWFDKGFKANEINREHSDSETADLWIESPDYAAVFDVAMEKLYELREKLERLDKEESAA